jgi:hypothetical protein
MPVTPKGKITRPIVNIKKHRVKRTGRILQYCTDITNMKTNPRIVQGIPEHGTKVAPIPLHNSRNNLHNVN